MLLKIDLPLRVIMKRKIKADKIWNMNLNIYRNTHHRILNDVKVLYKALVYEELQKSLQAHVRIRDIKVEFRYTLFPPSKRKLDVANILAVVDKFTSDALVEHDILEDDNFLILPKVIYQYGVVDKENPRAELVVSRIR